MTAVLSELLVTTRQHGFTTKGHSLIPQLLYFTIMQCCMLQSISCQNLAIKPKITLYLGNIPNNLYFYINISY
jgi:hypothetical protein